MPAASVERMTRDDVGLALGWAASEGWNPGLHDADIEIKGPAATDVHHNFVQRDGRAREDSPATSVAMGCRP